MSKSASLDNLYRYVATVERVVRETDDVVSIYFTTDRPYSFSAGQYLTVFFDDIDVPEGKAYSLSSSPLEDRLRITVKKRGEFSSRLCAMESGDCFDISPAYGSFDALPDEPMVALCSGVGIAPILSILKTANISESGRDIRCHHSLSYLKDKVHGAEADGFVEYYITREKVNGVSGDRIDPIKIAKDNLEKVFYVCGSVEFVRDMRNGLLSAGIDKRRISTEVFFMGG